MNKENPLLLHIETATEVCSVALSEGDRLLAVCESADGNSHSKNLLPFIDELCRESGRALRDIDGVSVSVGPGSYTGLRIGVSTAKGIAYALQVPVMAVGTLESIAYGALAEGGGECPAAGLQIVPMIDARRMEVFTCRYNEKMEEVAPAEALIVDEEAFAGPLAQQVLLFCGNGMPKCKELLAQSPNARFAEFAISARHLVQPALKRWKAGDFADTAYFEPFYLKEYVAAKPHVKGL